MGSALGYDEKIAIRSLVRHSAHPLSRRIYESMPDVPSLKDQGFNAEYAQWSGLFVPSGTPEAVVQRLRSAARMAAQDSKAREVIHNAGSPIQFLDSADFEKYVQADIKRMSEVVRRMGKLE